MMPLHKGDDTFIDGLTDAVLKDMGTTWGITEKMIPGKNRVR